MKEVFDSNASPIAMAGLERIAELYAIEKTIRGKPPAMRQAVRWTESAPLVNRFGVWLDEQRSRVSPRSRLGEKLTYIANQWDGLLVFLYDSFALRLKASCGACTTPATAASTASATSPMSSRSRAPRSTGPFKRQPTAA